MKKLRSRVSAWPFWDYKAVRLVGPVAMGVWAVLGLAPKQPWTDDVMFAVWILALVGLYSPAGRPLPVDGEPAPTARADMGIGLSYILLFVFFVVVAFFPDHGAGHVLHVVAFSFTALLAAAMALVVATHRKPVRADAGVADEARA